jgi:hypothetical protein
MKSSILPWVLAWLSVWLPLATLLITFMYLDYRKKIKEIQRKKLYWERFSNWMRAREACNKWRECNPFTNRANREAQELLRIHNGAYMLFLEIDPDFDKGRLEKYTAMMESNDP